MKSLLPQVLSVWSLPTVAIAGTVLTTMLLLSPVSSETSVVINYQSDSDQPSASLTARSPKPISPYRRVNLG